MCVCVCVWVCAALVGMRCCAPFVLFGHMGLMTMFVFEPTALVSCVQRDQKQHTRNGREFVISPPFAAFHNDPLHKGTPLSYPHGIRADIQPNNADEGTSCYRHVVGLRARLWVRPNRAQPSHHRRQRSQTNAGVATHAINPLGRCRAAPLRCGADSNSVADFPENVSTTDNNPRCRS
jgi:hypothetical protein